MCLRQFNRGRLASGGAGSTHFGFAGHTHGGGLRLPWIGPLLVPNFYGRFLDRGWFARQDSKLRITPGIGCFPARKSNNGELLRLKLVSSTDNS